MKNDQRRFLRSRLRQQIDRWSPKPEKSARQRPPGTSEDAITESLIAQGLDPLRLLEDLVAIDSTTDNRKGVNLVQRIIADRLSRLGFEISWLANPNGEETSGDLLVATLEPEFEEKKGRSTAKRSTTAQRRYINFVSHADTVLGLAEVGPLQIGEDGRTGRGAGVIDNKGGLAVALIGLELFLKKQISGKRRKFGIRFISSPNEEAGSVGFNDLFREFARDSVMALGFEPALDDGSIIRSRRGNRWYHVTVKGIEAHAGRSRGEHLNAAHELAIKIARLHKLNDLKNGVAVNVGHIQGGRDKFNVVCGFAEAKIDTRFSTFKHRDRLHEKLTRIFETPTVFNRDHSVAPQVEVKIADDCPPFSSTSRSRSLVRTYTQLIGDIEWRQVTAQNAGGAGDVNYMSDGTTVVIDGLGPIGGRMHTAEEFIHLPSLSTRALALSRFLEFADDRLT